RYYREQLVPRQMRNLLIAALFHDFDHPGHAHRGVEDPDRINIDIAIAGLRRYIMPGDRLCLPEIEALIEATHYPYKIASDALDLPERSSVTPTSLKRSARSGSSRSSSAWRRNRE